MSGAAALAQMWSKTGPNGAWHQLRYHLFDVAAVAQLLLERHVPAAIRRRLARRIGVSPADLERWVVFLAALHDFGKATPPFQVKFRERAEALKLAGLQFPRRAADTPHGQMTAGPETVERLVGRGWPPGLARQATRWVGGHHGVFPSDLLQLRAGDHVGSAGWVESREVLFDELWALFAPTSCPTVDDTVADVGLFVAGLTSVADWIGSMSEHFPFETAAIGGRPYFEGALVRADRALAEVGWRQWRPGSTRSFEQLFGFTPRPLQSGMASLVAAASEQFFAVVEAPMGEGKTEAAFWAAHELARTADHRGTYFALPTMATANQMFLRTQGFLERSYEGRLSLQLLHGGAEFSDAFSRIRGVVDDDTRGRRLAQATSCGTVIAEEWFSKRKRGLLSQFAVGTIDQALLGVMRTKHGFVRLFGLSGKTVVLDEVHAYDAYTSRILDRLVAWLRELGASVVILSATLPRARRDGLCGQWTKALPAAVPYPRITAFADDAPAAIALPLGAPRAVQIERIETELEGALEWLYTRISGGGCGGLIVNTVSRAQQATRLARERWPDLEVRLLHARFFSRDRADRETRLLGMLGKAGIRPHRVLVIGTQVLEQSLDIDFDVLATDHGPIDLLLQRTGRLHRHSRGRPPGLEHPTLGIIEPESPAAPDGPSFGVHKLIYEESVLLRSWVVLRGRQQLELPVEIESLVEQVYGSVAPQAAREVSARMARLDAALADSIGATERDAEQRLLASPDRCVDDPFREFGLPLDEDNPEIAQQLQALTRLGEPTVHVAFLTDASMAERSPAPNETRAIVERSLSLSSKSLVFALRAESPPASWSDSPWLRNTRAVVMTGGRARVGNKELIDDPELGLVIATPEMEDT